MRKAALPLGFEKGKGKEKTMEISLLLMQQIAQLFLILIMGYAVVKVGLLKASDSRVLSVVMVYLVTPCVIINAFQIDDTPEIRKGLLYSMAIAAAIHVVLLVLSALLSRPLKLDAVEQVNVIYSNAAALVIPLVKALMGDAYVIYSCAFIIVQLVLLWTHASSLLQGSSALDWKKVLTNINMIAIAAGALLYWFRVVLPAPLQNTMSTVGNMMGPMGMLLAGMAIAEKPLREVFCTRRNYLPTVLRLVVCPLVVLVLLLSQQLLGFFNPDANVIALGTVRLWYIVAPEFLQVFIDVFSGALRGYGYSLGPAILTLVGICGVRIIWLYSVFAVYSTYDVLMACYSISWLVTGAMIVGMYIHYRGKILGANAK